MKTIFIPDLINIIGRFIIDYKDVKALKHTCTTTYYLNYDIIINEFIIKKYLSTYNLIGIKNFSILSTYNEDEFKKLKYVQVQGLKSHIYTYDSSNLKEMNVYFSILPDQAIFYRKEESFNDHLFAFVSKTNNCLITSNDEIMTRTLRIMGLLIKDMNKILTMLCIYPFNPLLCITSKTIIFFNYDVNQIYQLRIKDCKPTRNGEIQTDISYLFKDI